jgi:beta-N-acetylhexosaminidase
MSGRELARDPETASAAMADAVAGWEAGGVAATAKHFPGLGGATVNTDFGPATVQRSRAELDATDLPPFEAAIDAGVPLVMIGHARYPALDPDRIASQSAPILRDLLRRRLGFDGVVVTDSMEARASIATGSITTVSERAVRAGADLLLLTGRGSYRPVYDHLLALARRSPAFRLRVRESAARVLALRARYSGP